MYIVIDNDVFRVYNCQTVKKNDRKQIHILAPQAIKERAQQEANLAFRYGWIEAPTVTALFCWTVTHIIDPLIRQHIGQKAEQPESAPPEETQKEEGEENVG